MNIFLIVESGGEYSDRYHRNVMAFLTREEAEAYLKEKREGFALFDPYCGDNDRSYAKIARYYSHWEKENLVGTLIHHLDFGIPAGTPNRRKLIQDKARELEARRDVWAKNEMQKDIDAALNDPACPLSEVQKKILIAANFRNPYESDGSDLEIEEVPVKKGSKLWNQFNK